MPFMTHDGPVYPDRGHGAFGPHSEPDGDEGVPESIAGDGDDDEIPTQEGTE